MTVKQPEDERRTYDDPSRRGQPDPSQAEGERFPGKDAGVEQQDVKYTPSQAEGDRETVERDLAKKEREGYFKEDQEAG